MRHLREQNVLIQSIPAEYRKLLLADLTRVEIKAHGRVCAAGEQLTRTFFPTTAVISALCGSNGKSMEVHGVGRDGMLGPSILFAAEHTRFDWVCQIGGAMLVMPSLLFEQHARANDQLRRAVALYSMGAISSLTQSVACNGMHSIAQRCARWLLVTGDRAGASEFLLTHELLARMLGVQRSGVSIALSRLQTQGIVHYRSGLVCIRDRSRLELESCECYGVVVRDTRLIRARAR